MQREPPKSCSKPEIELDRISNLPSDVMDQILSFLTLKEVVRTSVLSSKWRYKWAMLPHLVFDELSVSSAQNHNTFVKIVDHVLLLHNGPIDKVKLSHPDLLGTEDVDRWILHLSRNSIKELRFDFQRQPPYKMPSCFFSCQDMVHLDLCNCLLKPPTSFRGFQSLENIKIEGVTLSQDDFEKLIVCCPLLKSLTMLKCHGFTHLKIDAPNLQCFFFQGAFRDLNLENTARLRVVSINMKVNNENSRFLALLAICSGSLYFEEPAVVGEVNSWLYDNQNCPFTQLRLVKITVISGIRAELDFIRFLLSSSPVLERMTISTASVNNSSELLKKLIQLKRASAHAVIIYSDK